MLANKPKYTKITPPSTETLRQGKKHNSEKLNMEGLMIGGPPSKRSKVTSPFNANANAVALFERPKGKQPEAALPPAIAILNEKVPNLVYDISDTQAGSIPFFTAILTIDGKKFEGAGKSKKLAKQLVAERALEYVEQRGFQNIAPKTKPKVDPPPVAKKVLKILDNVAKEGSNKNLSGFVEKFGDSPTELLYHLKDGQVNYVFVNESINNNVKLFTFALTVDNRTFQGTAGSKKLAKQAAAKLALKKVCGIDLPDSTPPPTNAPNMTTKNNKPENPSSNFARPAYVRGKEVWEKLSGMQGPMYDLPPILDNGPRKFSNSCRLWVGNCPKNFSQETLREIFENFGECDEIYYDEAKRFGFVQMDFKVNAEKARQELHQNQVNGARLIVRFSASGSALKVRNLSPWVTNELLTHAFGIFGDLEKAIVITDEKGKPTGEGIVEFCKRPSAMFALKKISQGVFCITSSPRPVIIEPLAMVYDGEGYKEMDLNMNSREYIKERQKGPRFAKGDSFESVYGRKWKQVYEIYDKKKEMLDKELLLEEKKLLEEIELQQYQYETELLREQVREREEAMTFNSSGMTYMQNDNFNFPTYY